MAKKSKMSDYLKRARKGMLGFTITWSDSDPFSENGSIEGGVITHKNPTQKLVCRDMWKRCSQWIVSTEFTWVIEMRVIFETPTRTKIEDYEFRHTCTLRGINSEAMNDAMELKLTESRLNNAILEDGHKNKGEYKTCEFIAKVVGI